MRAGTGGRWGWRLWAGLLFATVLGCDDSFDLPDAGFVDATVAPDAASPAPDAGPVDLGETVLIDAAVSISGGNINPFSERAASGRYTLRGRLRSSDPRPSESARFKLRGGFVPLSPE